MRAIADIAPGLQTEREQTVVSVRSVVAERDVARFVRDALRSIRMQCREHDQVPSGPPFALCRPIGTHHLVVEAGWPVDHPNHTSGDAHAGTLPAILLPHSVDSRARHRQLRQGTVS
jgi:hypothetical protein